MSQFIAFFPLLTSNMILRVVIVGSIRVAVNAITHFPPTLRNLSIQIKAQV